MKTAQEASRALTNKSTSRAGIPDMAGWAQFAHAAEEAGIDSVLISFSRYEPDTLMMAAALGQVTESLTFIVAFRSGLMQPTAFVQQINTLSGLIGGRVSVNIVAGSSPEEQRGYGDFLSHDERYARTEEFLTICHAYWRDNGPVDFSGNYFRVEQGKLSTPFLSAVRRSPEIYIAGHSDPARRLAVSHGSGWMRLIDTPENLRPQVAAMREQGTEVALRLAIVARPTRDAAIQAAHAMLPGADIERQERRRLRTSDSQVLQDALAAADEQGWLNDHVWAGFVPYYGSSAVALVGSYEELAQAFLDYQQIGVTQFVISGWPKLDEMLIFGREVLPRVRAAEPSIESDRTASEEIP